MDEKTKQQIKERFNSLPESIQEIILSTHYQETLVEIGKQYNLNVEQLGMMEIETTMAMMGLTPVRDFEAELTREIKVDPAKGSQIVKDINEKIFLKIRDLLKLMNTPTGVEPSIDEETNSIKILNSAGIEILPTQPVVTPSFSTTPDAQKREETLEKIEKKETIITHIETPKLTASNELMSGTLAPTISAINPIIKPAILTTNEIHPMITQKNTSVFQIPMVKTEHSLENISKTTIPAKPPQVSTTDKIQLTDIKTTVPQAPKVYPKGGDPYRTNPE